MAFFKKTDGRSASTTLHKVLLVDDEPTNLETLGQVLRGRCQILHASDGQQALDMVLAMPPAERPALVISDQRMPNLTGVELCERLRDVAPETMCMIVTGYTDVDAIVDSINRTRIFQFVIKPYNRNELLLIVERALEAHDMKRQLNDHLQNLERKVEERTKDLEDACARTASAHRDTAAALDALQKSKVALVRMEKLAALGQLVEGVAHEINTPVGIGITAASSLRDNAQEMERLLNGGKMKKSDLSRFLNTCSIAADMILEHLGRAATVVEAFKSTSVGKSVERRVRIDLKLWLDETMISLDWQLAPLGIHATVACPPGIELDSYSDALLQIINNLVRNVSDHAYPGGQGGPLRIEAGWNGDSGPGRQLRLAVADDGVGIAPDVLDKIFNPFFTTKRGNGNTGLGLNVVYNIVTGTFKGSIECQSVPGKGCRMLMLLDVDT